MPDRPKVLFALIHTDANGREQVHYYPTKRRAVQAAKELQGHTRIVGVKL